MKTWLKLKLQNFLGIDDSIKRQSSEGFISPMALQEEMFLQAQTPKSMSENYLFDFKNYQAGKDSRGDTSFNITNNVGVWGSNTLVSTGEVMEAAKPVGKIKIKPIDVVRELHAPPDLLKLNNLDDKILVLKDKEKLISQAFAKQEVSAMIERLENRKKYPEFKDYFNFPNTTQEQIDALLDKYELVMKPSDIFIPEFPDEAIAIMKSYTEKVAELCGKKPVFYVIAEDIHFKRAYDKRDPILLVQSPFAFHYDILGAWDKEMLILSSL